ncbi:MAG: HAMP domain-containing histidine kinase [Phycisphaerae bacterium]|nr:HAMP domain-containing histidine kinase [Phycisphaerae bacterium]
MEPLPQDVRLVKRAFWLIRLRWVAIAGLCVTTFIADRIFSIGLPVMPIYIIAGCLALYNIIVLLLLRRSKKNHFKHGMPRLTVKKIIHFQMSADLLILTVLFHFSGGVENPFIVYYVFHMIIASILLSEWESYLQATFASSLLLLLALLEYRGIIEHHCLKPFVVFEQYNHALFVFGTVTVVASALYLVVFMASSISTRLRNQEQGYWEANQLLAQKDRIKDEYVERVTHDIKGHLAAIKSSLDVVARGFAGSLKPQQQEFVDRAVDRTGVLATFVRQLLKLTQMRLSNRVENEEFSVDEVMKNAVEAAKVRAEDKGIRLESEIEGYSFKVVGDRLSVEEMITNLIYNAVKYTPAGGQVKVRALENSEHIIVSVKDTGIGIPSDELPRIFEEFYRASNARACEKDGTGLGLSIAKQIIESHGGQIRAESQLGEGTKVEFTLVKTCEGKN